MRSYYAHLEQTKPSPAKSIPSKPIFRSSAIFPVVQAPGISSRILFLGYWILKRNIKEIACVVTLRSIEGEILARSTMEIKEPKTYRVELRDQLQLANRAPDEEFMGSIEMEFFSTQNLVFTFPALDINYYGTHFSAIVHTAQRIYNDFDDLRNNSQTSVPESGFNIYATQDQEPFFTLINGANSCENSQLKMEFFNKDGETLTHTLELGTLKPYQTTFCFPARFCALESFLKGDVGTAKITFNISWAFPRLVAGNWNRRLPAISITHTYYDCEKATSKSDYWFSRSPEWHAASLMIPATFANDHFTNVYFYPIYSPSHFSIGMELYDEAGRLLGAKNPVMEIESPSSMLKQVSLNELCQELLITDHSNLAIRLVAYEIPGKPLPARIKIGLDLGGKEKLLPCNICVNLQPFNPAFEGKTSTFRWLPFLADQPHPTVWIMNSSPEISYQKEALLTITFFHEQDDDTIVRSIKLAPNGFILYDLQDNELKAFFANQAGWLTVQSTNPYTTTYYFTESNSGVIGGDHGF
ncbi:MAG: hypothetical protein CK425_07595 [Parachlamydia sp.]|nr:MAG: hypothetical protein CK425_07595 [Parachlamydia sp.]